MNPEQNIPKRIDIMELSIVDPVVNAGLQLFHQGDWIFEQALIKIVTILAHQKDELQKECLRHNLSIGHGIPGWDE